MEAHKQHNFPAPIYESTTILDSYKDKSKRKLIDLSFSNRSDCSGKDNDSETCLELGSEDD
jgi:hypothetical protein